MKMNWRVLNVVVQNLFDGSHSLRRLDPYKHLFYRSRAEAEAMANKGGRTMMERFLLPHPAISFAPFPTDSPMRTASLDFFALLGPRDSSDGRVINASRTGETVLYDADEHHFLAMPCLVSPKGRRPVCVSVAHPGADEDSLFVMGRNPGLALRGSMYREGLVTSCFEALEFVSGRWVWRQLPPPPFVHRPGFQQCQIIAHTTMVDAGGCTSIYVSCDNGIGTYRFDTLRTDSSHRLGRREVHAWKHVGEWKLPFEGEALYVPEFNLWFGLSRDEPNHLCAADLSAAAADDHGREPTLRHVWEDVIPPEGERWLASYLKLVHLGDGMFCIAKTFEALPTTGQRFHLLVGVEIVRDEQGGLRMVKHRCTRYMQCTDNIEWVL